MNRRAFLWGLGVATAALAGGWVAAGPVDDITAEIRAQGFEIVKVERTWLGRVRIIGQSAGFRREVVIDPTTGEIRRDLVEPRAGGSSSAPAAKPKQGAEQPGLGSSRGLGQTGTEAEDASSGNRTGDASGGGGAGGDDSSWGGGWGSYGGQEKSGGGSGNGNGGGNGKGNGGGNGKGNGKGNGGGNGKGNGGGGGKGGGGNNGGGKGGDGNRGGGGGHGRDR